jgi:hypothetical protein
MTNSTRQCPILRVLRRWLTGSYPASMAGFEICKAPRAPLRVILPNSAGARTAYQDFFGLWKAADPDISTLKQAKEYEKLQ